MNTLTPTRRDSKPSSLGSGIATTGGSVEPGEVALRAEGTAGDASPFQPPAGRPTPSVFGGATDQGAQTNDRARPGTA